MPGDRHGVLQRKLRRKVVGCALSGAVVHMIRMDEGPKHVTFSVEASKVCAPRVGCPASMAHKGGAGNQERIGR